MYFKRDGVYVRPIDSGRSYIALKIDFLGLGTLPKSMNIVIDEFLKKNSSYIDDNVFKEGDDAVNSKLREFAEKIKSEIFSEIVRKGGVTSCLSTSEIYRIINDSPNVHLFINEYKKNINVEIIRY